MSNYVRNFGVKNYENQTTIPQLIADNMSGCFFSETRCILQAIPQTSVCCHTFTVRSIPHSQTPMVSQTADVDGTVGSPSQN